MTGHEPLVWGPAVEGEQTASGATVRAGWVWTCTCGAGGDGYPTEDDADHAATEHVEQGWWVISGDHLMRLLTRAHNGEEPDLLYVEAYANARTDGAQP